jgi:hypothetical protein
MSSFGFSKFDDRSSCHKIAVSLIDLRVSQFSVSEIACLHQLSTMNSEQLARDLCRLSLLQLRVLRLGFLQDGDVGVGVFPEGEEIIVGGECPDAGNIGIRSLRRKCSTDRRRRW